MKYLSVCSGIEAASVAWAPLGWEPVAFAEIDPFASAVLAARHPTVPNLGNMEGYRDWEIPPFDLLVGGTPCQSFSVAGLRRGLDDPRGNLALVYLGLVDRFRPRWVVWENVPGVLSSSGGRDFGSFLGGLAQLGYGFAYRVLDAQYVRVESHPGAVPQRRRRVFVVGCARGDAKRAAEVLLELEGVRGDLAPRREAGKAAPRGARAGAASGGEAYNLVPAIAGPLGGAEAVGFEPRYYLRDNKTGGAPSDTTALTATAWGYAAPHVAIAETVVAPALTATNDPSRSPQSAEVTQQVAAVHSASLAVRRLTPRECERLQGFSDDYTLIEYRGKPASDGPRYKALGNSMAVNVMRWIGARIAQYESEGVVADLRAVSEELRELVGSVEALVELDTTQRDALREVLEEVRRRRFALRDALNAAELAEKALLLKIPGLSGP